jgi:hypothetical protein
MRSVYTYKSYLEYDFFYNCTWLTIMVLKRPGWKILYKLDGNKQARSRVNLFYTYRLANVKEVYMYNTQCVILCNTGVLKFNIVKRSIVRVIWNTLLINNHIPQVTMSPTYIFFQFTILHGNNDIKPAYALNFVY